jgi:hypothetical protein
VSPHSGAGGEMPSPEDYQALAAKCRNVAVRKRKGQAERRNAYLMRLAEEFERAAREPAFAGQKPTIADGRKV